MPTTKRLPRIPLLLGAVGALAPAIANACAVCLADGSSSSDPIARGFYWGILLLMAMPFAIVASIGAWVVLKIRRDRDSQKERPHLRLIWTKKES